MRVLVLTNLYPNPLQPHRAPYNRHQLRILNETSPVRVIAPVAWTQKQPPRRTELDGIIVDHPRYYYPPGMLRGLHGHSYLLSVKRTYDRVVREFQPDIVFAPWIYPDGWAATRLEHGRPVILQTHGSDIKLLDEFPAKKARSEDALRHADGVVAVSNDLATDVTALGAKAVKVIYDGVDDALFHPASPQGADASRAPVVLYVGNLVPVKSVITLIDAMRGVDGKLMIVGGGPLRNTLEAAATGMNVEFTGSIPLTQLPAYYQSASLFVLPSHSEGVPNVLLEASACGTPWVASDVGGIPEIAHLGASRLVPPRDVAALRAAIMDMLKNPPPIPDVKPRLRVEAVKELEEYLKSFL